MIGEKGICVKDIWVMGEVVRLEILHAEAVAGIVKTEQERAQVQLVRRRGKVQHQGVPAGWRGGGKLATGKQANKERYNSIHGNEEVWCLDQSIDGLCQGMVFFRNLIAGIVCIEVDVYFVIHIGPVRVMIMLLRQECHPGHEGKGFTEILERECTMQTVIFFLPHS